jgi:Holliday junction resolvasome RuvABC endonuclease subunit
MSKVILGLDTGTINTGFVKVEVKQGEIFAIHDAGMIQVKKLETRYRLAAIVRAVVTILDKAPRVTEMWTELFQFYGARKGALWNAMLVGALIYLPVTRQRRDLTSYSTSKSQWWSWYKTYLGCSDKKDMWPASKAYLEQRGVEISDEHEALFAGSQHLNDALGVLLFAVYGAENDEYFISDTTN